MSPTLPTSIGDMDVRKLKTRRSVRSRAHSRGVNRNSFRPALGFRCPRGVAFRWILPINFDHSPCAGFLDISRHIPNADNGIIREIPRGRAVTRGEITSSLNFKTLLILFRFGFDAFHSRSFPGSSWNIVQPVSNPKLQGLSGREFPKGCQ